MIGFVYIKERSFIVFVFISLYEKRKMNFLELLPRIGCLCSVAVPFVLLSKSTTSKRNALTIQFIGGIIWTVSGIFLIKNVDVTVSSACGTFLSYLGLAGKEHILERFVQSVKSHYQLTMSLAEFWFDYFCILTTCLLLNVKTVFFSHYHDLANCKKWLTRNSTMLSQLTTGKILLTFDKGKHTSNFGKAHSTNLQHCEPANVELNKLVQASFCHQTLRWHRDVLAPLQSLTTSVHTRLKQYKNALKTISIGQQYSRLQLFNTMTLPRAFH